MKKENGFPDSLTKKRPLLLFSCEPLNNSPTTGLHYKRKREVESLTREPLCVSFMISYVRLIPSVTGPPTGFELLPRVVWSFPSETHNLGAILCPVQGLEVSGRSVGLLLALSCLSGVVLTNRATTLES